MLIGGGATAYWVWSRRAGLSAGLPAGSKLIPDEATLVVSVSTDERQWLRLRQLGTPETQAQLDQTLVRWRDRLLTSQGYSFQSDIAPWVADEITFALLPQPEIDDSGSAPSSENAPDSALSEDNFNLQQPLIAVLPIADSIKAQEILGRSDLSDPSASTPSTESAAATETAPSAKIQTIAVNEYRGVEVRQMQGADGDRLWTAVLGKEFIAIATTAAAAETAIDTFKGGESIAQLPKYGQAFTEVANSQTFAKFYANLPTLSAAIAANSQPPILIGNLPFFQASQGLVGTVEVTSEGLHMSSLSWLAPGSDRTYTVSNEAIEMPRRLPAETLVMASGGNLQNFWQDYAQGATAGSLLPFDPNNLSVGIKTISGLDIEADLMPWMAGEFALAAMPSAAAGEPAIFPIDFVFLVEVSDRTAAEATLAQLDQVVADRYRFQVKSTAIDGKPVTLWVSPFQSITFAHGWIDGHTAFLSTGKGATEALVSQSKSLAETSAFQKVVSTRLKTHNGEFFLDLQQASNLQQSLLPAPNAQEPAILKAIHTIGVTAAVQDSRSILYDVYVTLAKGNRPGALSAPDEVPSSPQTESSTPAKSEE
ncbi:MAG: DUF3352 domain-containing protein [Leptolyngbyaceae cyanobacterium SM1_1_3]|nr:DUF3352 domain-containing protein [Leptolyngbyaceae cyanobacterium SM1_1_3]